MWLSRTVIVSATNTTARLFPRAALTHGFATEGGPAKTPSELKEEKVEVATDPFDSVPLRKLATYLGETFAPKLEEIKEAERRKARPKNYTEVHEPPQVPHFLPLTRWAAKNEQVRETLIVDEKRRQRPRLSWYHPEDSMVPRGWFIKGLLEDIKYYRPFGKKKETTSTS